MKKYLSSSVIVFLVSFLASFSVNQGFALTYPGFTPSGENTGGTFNTYFNNMYFGSGVTDLVLDYSKGCKVDEVVRGYTSTGILLCIIPIASASTTTLGFSGPLVGTERYIPRYTANGTGITNSQIYDNSGATVTIGTGVVTPVSTRLEVLGGDIKVNDVKVGQGGTTSGLSNTAVGSSVFNSTSGFWNTAVGYWAGLNLNSGNNNTFLGYSAGSTITTGNNNIAIGSNAQVPVNTNDNQLAIGTWIYGVNGDIGIGTSTPTPGVKLEVAGQVKITGGTPGINKVLMSDASGLATWQTFTAGSAYATGVIVPPGSNNYVAKFDAAGSGIVASVLYESGGNIGLGMISPGARLEVAGQVKITGGAPGLGKILISDASGLASWTSYVSGSYATGIISSVGSDGYLSKFGPGGMGIFSSQIYDNATNVGIGTATPGAKLEVAGQVKITGGSPGLGKMLTSDASGLASWSNVVLTGGTVNYVARWLTATGLSIGVMYDNGTNVGIGTSSPTAKLTINSTATGVTGIKFTQVTSASTPFAGGTLGLGVDGSGNVVPISNGDVIVYTAEGGHPKTTTPDPDLANRLISYDFNQYFSIPTKQSFVVSDGGGAGYNAPYFKENGVSGICSSSGSPYDCITPDPATGLSASPNNSFTMTAKGPVYGYQLALGARGDAPLFARSGKFVGAQTGGLFLSDNVTPTPWQKVLTVPANHIEYMYVNIGYNSQLQAMSGGGNVGIGTSTPDRRLVIASSGTTTATDQMVQIRRGSQGADANLGNTYGTPYINIGGLENRTGAIQTIGFGYNSLTGTVRYAPAEIGFLTTSVAGNTQGDIVFANRNGTGNAIPTEVMRIRSNGNVGIGTTSPRGLLEVAAGTGAAGTGGLGVFLAGQNAAPGNNHGGTIFLNPGLKTGTGTAGVVSIGYTPAEIIAKPWLGNNALMSKGYGYFEGGYIAGNTYGMNWGTSSTKIVGAGTSNTTDYLNFSTNSLSRFYINGSGSVGIGTVTPGYNFDVIGTGSFYGLRVSSGATNGYVLTSDTTGNASWQAAAVSSVTATGIISGSGSANYLSKFGPTGTGIYASVVYETASGNIGINTTSPSYRLQVAGTGAFYGLRISSGAALNYMLTSDATGNATWQSLNDKAWGINGNSGTNPATQFIGTTDNVDLVFKRNNIEGFRLSGASGNLISTADAMINGVIVGRGAGNIDTNTAVGSGALSSNSSGLRNTANGYRSLYTNTSGVHNVANGYQTLRFNTNGNYNTANGSNALFNNIGGSDNTANGMQALFSNTTGDKNTANGVNSLYYNTGGSDNATNGYQALFLNTTGNSNTANGNWSLYNNTTGNNNTANGYRALYWNSNGNGNVAFGSGAGSNLISGNSNIAIGSNTDFASTGASNQLNIGNWIYGSGGNIGIGTNTPGARLEINSGIPNVAGLRFTNLNPTSPLTLTGTVSVGINALGDLVPISPVSNIAVYTAIAPSAPPTPNPDFANTRISYDFNQYFAINTKQSFVVSKGDSHGDNAPYFSENAASTNCRRAGTLNAYSPIDCETRDPITGDYATPDNSFTMSARGDTYGYQLALGARGDAPLFARSGKFSFGSTGGLYLSDDTTPSPWLKILSFPANHPEYFYINTGYSSQLLTQSGGGQVAIGTTMPNSRFEIWTGASTAPLMHFRGNGNVALGLNALNTRAGTGVITLHSKNTAIGYSAGSGMITGSNNIYIGANTLAQTGGSSNTINIGNIIFANNLPTVFGSTGANVGVDIVNPTEKLQVAGVISSTNNGAKYFQGGDDAALYDINVANGIGIYGVQNPDRAVIQLGNRAGQQISSNGGDSFGIGTAPNASYKLAVGGDVILPSGSWFRTQGSAGWYNNTWGGGWYMTDATWVRSYLSKSIWVNSGLLGSDGGLTVGYGGTSPSAGGAIILGNVGIGTSTPTQKLQVNGKIRIVDGSELNGRILVSDGSGVGTWQDAGTSSIDWHANGNATTNPATDFVGTIDSQDLVFRTNNTEKLRLTTSGSLGLGISTPGVYKFYNNGTSYFSGNIDIRPTRFIGFQNTSTIGDKSGISWSNNSASGNALNSIYLNKDQVGKNSLVFKMDSDNNYTDEFVWLHDRTGTLYDATPMRLAANYGNFYSGAIEISNPLPGGTKQVGFNTSPGSYAGGAPVVDINGKIRIHDGSEVTGKVLVSDNDGVGTWVELASSSGSLGFWKTIGNSGTTSVGNYIGTSDNVDFVIKANALEKIYVSAGTSNLRIGGDMMLGRGGGNISGNTAMGIQALQQNSVGTNNTAIGYFAARNTTTSENTALGYESLLNNITGGKNTTIGHQALYTNTNSWNSTAIGNQALYSSTGSAQSNTAVGYQAGYGITSGSYNIAIGYQANIPTPTANNQLSIGNWIYGVGGLIGIGTTAPGAKLEVNGNTILSGSVRIAGGSPGTNKILMSSDNSGNAIWGTPSFSITGGTTNYITRWTSATTLGSGQLYDDGTNIGISTTTPGAKLDVKGGNIAVDGSNGYAIRDYLPSDGGWRIGMNNSPGFTRALATSYVQYLTFYDSALYGFAVGANGGLSSFEVTGASGGYNAFFRGNVGIGTATPGQKLTLSGGTIQIINGTQASGAYLQSDGSGVGTWVLPLSTQKNEWIYRNNAIQSTSDDITSFTSLSQLTSVPLPASAADESYVFEVVGNYSSDTLNNGLALSLQSNCPAQTTDVIGSVNIGMGNGESYLDGFFNPGDPVTSSGVAAINTKYPFSMNGTFRLGSSCKVVVKFANEINANNVTIGVGTYLIIRVIKREAPGSAV